MAGGFYEGISFAGEPLDIPRRAMVQARQIYSLRTAEKLGLSHPASLPRLVQRGTANLLTRYSLPSGAFLHSLDREGRPVETQSELYTQAFVLFGLAHAYSLDQDARILDRARALLRYLQTERRAAGGGYSEWSKQGTVYASNPHMHLFEAALAWMAVDKGREWRALADELLELCRTKFIQAPSGILAEHFREGWRVKQEAGRFVFEPGHHFEWAWLMMMYEDLTGIALGPVYRRLIEIGETRGIAPGGSVVCDEVWSDFAPKKKTSRYWPQCERIKAAVQLAARGSADEKARFARVADTTLATLFLYLDAPVAGFCYDHMLENGQFADDPPKASFLYHVVNALDEYITVRPRLG